MEQHPIPRQITTFEFKLIGFMTLKQFIYLVIAFPIGYIVFSLFPIPILNIVLAVLIVVAGLVFAFVPIQDRPVEVWIRNLIKRLQAPTQYFYHKNNKPLYFLNDLYFLADPHHMLAHIESKEKLAQYLTMTKQKHRPDHRKKQIGTLMHEPTDQLKKDTMPYHTASAQHEVPSAQNVGGTGTANVSDKATTPSQPSSISLDVAAPASNPPSTPAPLPPSAQAPAPTPPAAPEPEPTPFATGGPVPKAHPPEVMVIPPQPTAPPPTPTPTPPPSPTMTQKQTPTTSTRTTTPVQSPSSQENSQDDKKPQHKPFVQAHVVAEPPKAQQPPAMQASSPAPVQREVHKPVPKVEPGNQPFYMGVVRTGKRIPLPGVMVYIKDAAGNPIRLMKTNPHGVFATYNALPVGTYTLEIKDPNGTYFFDTMNVSVKEHNPLPVEIQSKEIL